MPERRAGGYAMREFSDNVVKQRAQLRLTRENLDERIEKAPFGEKTKALARKWAELESVGGPGCGVFDIPPVFVSGKGALLYDADGKEYVDMLAGHSVSNLGHCNDELTAIIQQQAAKLTHCFDYPHEERIRLAEKLVAHSRMDDGAKVVFGVTGSEAIELAVRAARYYTGQPFILTAYGDYHGVTYGTMGLTGKGSMQSYFYPIRPDQAIGHFHFPHSYRSEPGRELDPLKAFERLLDSSESPYTDGTSGVCNVAAIVVEPFQSAAGYYVPPVEYLQELRRIADKFGMLLVVDEIQAGMGRSGKLWAFEHSGIVPDMIVTSKTLGGGVPLSAVIARGDILGQWGPGAHVATQAANVLACAAGNYVLDTVSSDAFLERVNEAGEHLVRGLRTLESRHAIIGYIDNRGLYTGVELVLDRETKEPAMDAAGFIRDRAVGEGLLFERGGYYNNRLQLIPPLTITNGEIDRAIAILDTVLGEAETQFKIG
tara:strand:- start:2314 stop:3771 length:1458 start_codon:yes stop_codon:yes gene_type:complete